MYQMKLKTIFFDVGDVLFNEDRLRFRILQSLVKALQAQGQEWTLSKLIRVRERRARYNDESFFHYDFAQELLGEEAFHAWFTGERYILTHKERYIHEILMPGMKELLERLHCRYKLGIIANQPVETEDALEYYGILKYFDPQLIGISDKVGLAKPEVTFFEWGLKNAGCKPDEAAMIGDRLEADIAPANRVGMTSIWFIPEVADKGWVAQDAEEEQYLQVISHLPNWRRTPIRQMEHPDVVVKSSHEISDYLA